MPAFADSPAPPQHRSSALGRPELARWRSALQEAGWTVDAVAERLGGCRLAGAVVQPSRPGDASDS